jgi:hypothetical protein
LADLYIHLRTLQSGKLRGGTRRLVPPYMACNTTTMYHGCNRNPPKFRLEWTQYALKGLNNLAQGNALGGWTVKKTRSP